MISSVSQWAICPVLPLRTTTSKEVESHVTLVVAIEHSQGVLMWWLMFCYYKEAIDGQFRFGLPRVYSVSPSYGPAAGGTIVKIRGEDLNIGNTERTTVSLVANGNTGRRRRQTMGTTIL